MRYIEAVEYKAIRNRYDCIVGWGTSQKEYMKLYNPFMYKIDYMINGKGENVGEYICGNKICSPDELENIKAKKVCVIIFANMEYDIIPQIKRYIPDADTIVSRLIKVGKCVKSYSVDNEDQIMLNAMERMGYKDFSYMDIGVCHSVIRNNTYLFYENGNTNGVLVEPNPIMVEYAHEYRPKNKIIPCGVCGGKDSSLRYYYSEDVPGFNTFVEKIAISRGIQDNYYDIPVKNINSIIEENFEAYPDIVDIDTEGMDWEILKALDFDRFKIKILCIEEKGKELTAFLNEKGYIHFMSTMENQIYILKDELEKYNKVH